MRLPPAVAAAVVFSTVVAASTHSTTDPPERNMHIGFFLGLKSMESAWQPVDDQVEFGAVMAFGRDPWPVEVAVDILESEGGGCEFSEVCFGTPEYGKTIEADLGVRKIWNRKGKILPYVGGGVGINRSAFVVDNDNVSAKSSDLAFGLWAGTGILFRPRRSFEFGLDARYSTARVDFNFGDGERSVNAGGLHYGVLLGFCF